MFFASSGPKKAGAVDHMGIYIGDGWMIHSSRFGVALAPVERLDRLGSRRPRLHRRVGAARPLWTVEPACS